MALVTSVTWTVVPAVVTCVETLMVSPAATLVYSVSIPLMTSAGRYTALPLSHPTYRNAEEKELRLFTFTATPATGVMKRNADVQDTLGSLYCAADEVADPGA